jgi:hypothetical protein
LLTSFATRRPWCAGCQGRCLTTMLKVSSHESTSTSVLLADQHTGVFSLARMKPECGFVIDVRKRRVGGLRNLAGTCRGTSPWSGFAIRDDGVYDSACVVKDFGESCGSSRTMNTTPLPPASAG